MEIMDDVLDLFDSMGDALAKAKRGARRVVHGEAGFSLLVMCLVILALGAVIITPLLVFVVTGQRAGEAHDRTTLRFYAADTGIQDGKWKVSSGDLPDWMKGDWDESVYAHSMDSETLYDLPDQVNGCDVDVEIRPMWLLEGLEVPSDEQQRTLDPVLQIVSNIIGGGEIQIIIICTAPDDISLDRIGVWIPKPFTYVEDSSNLDDPVVTQTDWRNGQVITFDLGSNVLFSDLPGGTGTRRVITFEYTPTDQAMDTSWSWCRTDGTDPKLAWSDDIKLYQVESTATDPDTGRSTAVVAHTMTNESMGTYLAYYGDYAVTGNALMRETDTDRVRDRLYKESPGEISVIPESGTARKIVLYWSGWKEYPEDVFEYTEEELHALANTFHVNQVSLRVEYDGDSYDLGVVGPAGVEWTVLPNGSESSPNGWSYGCNFDITDLVKDALPDDFVGNATYWVGHADPSGEVLPSANTMQGIWGSSDSDVFVVGIGGTVLHYDNVSWATQSSGTTRDLRGVWGTSSTNLWAVGANSAIRKYTGSWAGQTRSDGRTETLNGVWGSTATDVWVVGNRYTRSSQYRYTLLHTTNGGTSWTNTGDSMTNGVTMNGVWGSGSSNVIAVGNSGRILRYNGSAWVTMTSGTSETLYGVWGTAANNIYAVGANGTILRYNGTSWSAMASGTTRTLYGVWGSAANDIYAVGSNGTILRYNGTSWSAMTSGTTRILYGVWGTGSTNVYVVGETTGRASTILHWDGVEWSSVGGGTGLWTWSLPHSGDGAPAVSTDYPLSDVVDNEWANACWSVITIYTSPETLAHQMYLFQTFRYWNSNNDVTFTLEGFLAPASVGSEDEAVKITYFVGEGDSWYSNGDNLYVNGTRLNPSYITPSTCAPYNNAMNSTSNSGGVTGYPPDDGIDLDTYTIDGSSGIIDPADSSATVRLTTGTDIWNMVYMILSFRSDRVGSGLVSYIVE